MPFTSSHRDKQAGRLLAEWRRDAGLSPERLSYELRKLPKVETVSARQIRRIETVGVVPTERVQFALAEFFGVKPSSLWQSKKPRRKPVAA